MNPLNELSAVEAASRIERGELTSEALLRACLDRISARETVVGAWQHLDAEGALVRARTLDRGPRRGLLHGLPIAVKDLVDTADMPTEYGSPIYAGHRPVADASCVAMARRAGAVVVGKSVTTEIANYTPGKTANPRNPAHTPGGSSSGTAAAVADHMVPFGFATQTAGSIIRPAAFCGVVGYKPTFGLIPRAGAKPLSDTLDTMGVIARSVEDCGLFAAAITGREALRVTRANSRASLRIGMCRTHEWPQAQPETVEAFERATGRLSKQGLRAVEATLSKEFAGLVASQIDIMGYEMARSLAWERFERGDKLSERLRGVLDAGWQVANARYDEAQAHAARCRAAIADMFREYDLLIAPAALGEAPKGLAATGDPLFCRIWTLLHLPCITVPAGVGPNGLPVGLQIIGRAGDDARLLEAAAALAPTLTG